MGMSEGGDEAERLPWDGLPRHEGYNAGQTRVPDAVQCGGRQRHKNLAGHDGRRPEGGS